MVTGQPRATKEDGDRRLVNIGALPACAVAIPVGERFMFETMVS